MKFCIVFLLYFHLHQTLPRITILNIPKVKKIIHRFSTTQEMLHFKPNIIVQKLQRQNNAIEFLERKLSDKPKQSKFRAPRKLPAAMNPPPGSHTDMLVLPTSIPQISAPRLMSRNFAKPTPVDYLSGFARKSDVTISKESSNNRHSLVAHPAVLNRKLNLQHSKQGQSKPASRSLTVSPYLDIGTGHVDVGSQGYSKLSYALFHPEASTMGPFVPRPNPPPPIRIQIHEPFVQSSRKMLVPEEVKQMFDLQATGLVSSIEDNLKSLETETKIIGNDFEEGFRDFTQQFQELQTLKKAKESKAMVDEAALEQRLRNKFDSFEKIAEQIKTAKNGIEQDFVAMKDSNNQKQTII